ncbi:MAG: hypothetical protein LBL66_04980 [Clostridiales bacterium]|nr:hypothetical protein [Clostridiales bacterium]
MRAPRNDTRGVCAPRNDKWGVPVFGRDCRVALCAPRNDTRGICAPRNDPVLISLQV